MSQVSKTIAVLTLPLLFTAPLPMAQAQEPAAAGWDRLILMGKVNDNIASDAQALGIQFTREGKGQFPARITKIASGSKAWARGLKAGDHILALKTSGQTTNITLMRNGKMYEASLSNKLADNQESNASTRAKPLAQESKAQVKKPQAPPKDLPEAAKPVLLSSISTAEEPLQKLAQNEIVLLVDKSGSMDTKDCPGGESRWDWCKEQTLSLSQKMTPYLKDGLTLVVFADNFTVYPHATMDQVAKVFQDNKPQGGTHTEEALRAEITTYLRTSGDAKPLLIAVITDGAPTNPYAVEQVIIDATRHMQSARQMKVVFLQIGEEADAGILLDHLQNDLVPAGARYNIVQSESFEQLHSRGLAKSLIDLFSP